MLPPLKGEVASRRRDGGFFAHSELKMENGKISQLQTPHSTLNSQYFLQCEQEEQLPQHSPFLALFIVLTSAETNDAAIIHKRIISNILILHHSYQKTAQMYKQSGKPCQNALPDYNGNCPLQSKLSFY